MPRFNAFMDFKDLLDCKHGIVTLNWIASKIDLNVVGLSVDFLMQ
jgi:hypothetical protein